MQFNTNSDQQDIVSEVLRITKATTGKYPLKDIARRVNEGIDRYFEIGFMVTGDSTLDDSNHASSPIGTQTITSGTNSYLLSAFTGTPVNITKLEVLDSNDLSKELEEERIEEVNFNLDYSTAITGVPSKFLRLGNYFYVRPCPNYTKSSGLKAFINRAGSYVASTDTTKTPGIPVFHHRYLARYAAQPYLEENSMDNIKSNFQHILRDEQLIESYWLRISKNSRGRMIPAKQNNR